MTVKLGQATP